MNESNDIIENDNTEKYTKELLYKETIKGVQNPVRIPVARSRSKLSTDGQTNLSLSFKSFKRQWRLECEPTRVDMWPLGQVNQ